MSLLHYELYGVAVFPLVRNIWLIGLPAAMLWLGFTRYRIPKDTDTEEIDPQYEMTSYDFVVTVLFWPLEVVRMIGDRIAPPEHD